MWQSRIKSSVVRWVCLSLLAGLSLSLLAAWFQQRANQLKIENAVSRATDQIADDLLDRLNFYQYGLRGERGAILTAGEYGINRDLYHNYFVTQEISREFPGVHNFGFIRRVPEADMAHFISQMHASGSPSFAIHQFSPHAGERWVIQYIEPELHNVEAIGLDIASEEKRRVAAEKAMLTGQTQLSAAVTLVRASTTPQTGAVTLVPLTRKPLQSFLILMPVYRTIVTPATLPERRAALFGWAYVSLSMNDALTGLLHRDDGLDLRLIDTTDPGHAEQFYDSESDAAPLPDLVTQGLQRDVFGRSWRMEFTAHPAFIEQLHLQTPREIFLIGVAISALLAALAGMVGVGRDRKSLIAEEQGRVASIVESSGDGIIGTTLEGVITNWNHGAEQIFGYSAAEAVGCPLASLIAPDDLQGEEEDILLRVRQGERVSHFETRRSCRDGRLIAVDMTTAPIRGSDGKFVGASRTVRDISIQKATEAHIADLNSNLEAQVEKRTAELNELNLLLSNVLNAASEVAIIATDRGGVIHIFNRGAEHLLGYQASELVDRVDPMLIHAPEEVTARSTELSTEYGRPVTGFRVLVHKPEIDGAEAREWTYIRKDGSRFPVTVVVTAMHDNVGQINGYLFIALDMTAQREIETSLIQAKEQSDAANAAKSHFLANMSHEIRTPMNAVLGLLQLMHRTGLDPRQQDYINKAETAAKALLGVLSDILDFSKIEAGKLQLDPQPFDIETLMRELAVVLSGNVGEKSVELLFEIDPALPRAVKSDRLRLQQILINLAGNAIKFTPRGEVVVSLRCKGRQQRHVMLEVAVRDTGIGIAPEHLERIFEGFNQAETSTTRRFGGTGLGLGISKRLVAMLGGDLTVRSKPDVGSCFTFCIPIEAYDGALPAVSLPILDRVLKVLVVDDNPVALQITGTMARDLGWHVEGAATGEDAYLRVTQAQASGQAFDVVLMDWRMPGMNGLATAEKLRAAEGDSSPPVIIMLTAFGRDVLTRLHATDAAPFSDFLIKPITPHQLVEAVARAIGAAPMLDERRGSPARTRRLAGLNVLVVEDNALNRRVAYELLNSEGARVSLAEGGIEGVNRVLSRQQRFDVVIMDIQMPDIDGMEATRRIRCDPDFRNLPILAMTANASPSDRQTCLAAGMTEHLGKPIDMEQLIPLLLRLTNTGSGTAPNADGDKTEAEAPQSDTQLVAALKRFGHNRKLYESELGHFMPECRRLLDELRQRAGEGDTKRMAEVMHSIKGIAATLGASGMALRAGAIEQDIKQAASASSVACDALLAELDALMESSHRALSAGLSSLALHDADINTGSPMPVSNAIQINLEALLTLLDSGDMRAVDMIDAISHRDGIASDARLELLARQVLALDFSTAAQTLRRYMSSIVRP